MRLVAAIVMTVLGLAAAVALPFFTGDLRGVDRVLAFGLGYTTIVSFIAFGWVGFLLGEKRR